MELTVKEVCELFASFEDFEELKIVDKLSNIVPSDTDDRKYTREVIRITLELMFINMSKTKILDTSYFYELMRKFFKTGGIVSAETAFQFARYCKVVLNNSHDEKEWLIRADERGHPLALYNLAVIEYNRRDYRNSLMHIYLGLETQKVSYIQACLSLAYNCHGMGINILSLFYFEVYMSSPMKITDEDEDIRIKGIIETLKNDESLKNICMDNIALVDIKNHLTIILDILRVNTFKN